MVLTDVDSLDRLSGSLSERRGAIVSDLRAHHVITVKREGEADGSALRHGIVPIRSTNQRENFKITENKEKNHDRMINLNYKIPVK